MPSVEEGAGDGGDNDENGRHNAKDHGYRDARIAVVVACTSMDGTCHFGRNERQVLP